MHSSMIGKIEKARKYAEEPERISFQRFTLTFSGDNDHHTVEYDEGEWQCTCHFFHGWQTCSHVMGMERILGVMVSKQESPVKAAT